MPIPTKLRDVETALSLSGNTAILDSGTLLGLVRDGDIISWDNDIDLLALNWSKTQVYRFNDAMRSQGYVVRNKRLLGETRSMTYFRRSDPIQVGLDLLGLNPTSDFFFTVAAFSPGRPRPVTVSLTSAKRFSQAARALVQLRRFSPCWHWAAGQVDLSLLRAQKKFAIFAIPADLLIPPKKYQSSSHLEIPAKPTAYLEFAYGESWKVPNQAWDTWESDARLWKC